MHMPDWLAKVVQCAASVRFSNDLQTRKAIQFKSKFMKLSDKNDNLLELS